MQKLALKKKHSAAEIGIARRMHYVFQVIILDFFSLNFSQKSWMQFKAILCQFTASLCFCWQSLSYNFVFFFCILQKALKKFGVCLCNTFTFFSSIDNFKFMSFLNEWNSSNNCQSFVLSDPWALFLILLNMSDFASYSN